MAEVEFTDEEFKPSNIRPVGQQDSETVVRKPSADLAGVDHHNDGFGARGEWPHAIPDLGRGPTQDGGGEAPAEKPVLDVKPNYPSGVGGWAMRPNTGESDTGGPETLSND
jgi:hypothetical protein